MNPKAIVATPQKRQGREMARQKKGGAQDVASPGTYVDARLVMGASDDLVPYYVNHAEVAHSKHEFAISFARIPTKFSAARLELAAKEKQIVVEPLVQVIIPVSLIAGLISALTNQKATFEERFGEIRVAQEGGTK